TYERLWNGWRAAYVGSPSTYSVDEGSVFSAILRSGLSDEDANVVHRGTKIVAMLNAFPYATGHMLILPYREVANLEDLEPDEAAELWSTVTAAVRAEKTAYSPGGINLGKPAGGSISEHLHVHVVPRWVGDGNFMTAIANTRTLPEALSDTAAKLRAAWPG